MKLQPDAVRKWRPLDVAANYRPSPAQLAFHQDRHKVPERAALAGTGGGKSFACGYEAFDITRSEPPGVGLIAAPDFPQLEISVYATLAKLFGRPLTDLEPYASFNQSKKVLDWWNGWKWRFVSMDDPKSVEGAPDGVFVWLNEARLVRDFSGPDGAWLNLTRRLRGSDARRRYAFLDTHSPTRQIVGTFSTAGATRYEARGGTFEVHDCVDKGRRMYQWGTLDAAAWGTINRTDAERIAAAYKGRDADRILHGRFARATGVVFDTFDPVQHVRKALPNLALYEDWSGGIDFGFGHPCHLTLHAYRGATVHTVRESFGTQWKLSRVAEEMKRLEAYAGPGVRVRWHSGADRPEHVDELQSMGFDVEPYTGRVQDGIDYLKGLQVGSEWLVDPSCKGVLEDQDNYIVKGDRGKGDPLEPDKAAYDAHGLDSCRYGIVGHRNTAVVRSWG